MADYSDLMKRLPDIAKVVNQFNSETVQQAVFQAITASLDAFPGAKASGAQGAPERKRRASSKSSSGSGATGTGDAPSPVRQKKAGSSPTIVADLNLRPKGVKSLHDFISEKKPSDDGERYACFVYYLSTIRKIDKISHDHIFTCFREMQWKVPNIDSGLNNTKTRKGWITSRARDNVTLSRTGLNFVEHDLPRKSS